MLEAINRFFGKREKEALLMGIHERIKLQIERKANDQKTSAGITSFIEEARRIAQACDMFNLGPRGIDNQNMFVLLGLEMLQYEPELGYAIASQMNRLEPEVGYKPGGRLMTTLGQMDSIKNAPIITRFSYLKERPELAHLIDDRDYRCLKAGKLIAVGILSAGQDIKGAANIYHKNYFDPLVKISLDKALRDWAPGFAEKIIE